MVIKQQHVAVLMMDVDIRHVVVCRHVRIVVVIVVLLVILNVGVLIVFLKNIAVVMEIVHLISSEHQEEDGVLLMELRVIVK